MHDTHSYIIRTPNFQLRNSGKKKFSCIIRINFFKFVAAKSILNLTFDKRFIQSVLTKIYIVHIKFKSTKLAY